MCFPRWGKDVRDKPKECLCVRETRINVLVLDRNLFISFYLP